MTIRPPKPEDHGAVVSLLRRMHEETRFSVFPLSESRLEGSVSAFLEPNDWRFSRVFERDGVVKGVFFGYMDDFWFSDALCGFDDVFYIAPEARGGSAAARMVKMFGEWCRERGCSAALVGVSSGVMVDRTGALLQRLGYERLGGLYRRHF